MKPIKVCVYKKSSPIYIAKQEEIEDAFQSCHLLIYNLTDEQKDKILELLDTFGDIVKHQME